MYYCVHSLRKSRALRVLLVSPRFNGSRGRSTGQNAVTSYLPPCNRVCRRGLFGLNFPYSRVFCFAEKFDAGSIVYCKRSEPPAAFSERAAEIKQMGRPDEKRKTPGTAPRHDRGAQRKTSGSVSVGVSHRPDRPGFVRYRDAAGIGHLSAVCARRPAPDRRDGAVHVRRGHVHAGHRSEGGGRR